MRPASTSWPCPPLLPEDVRLTGVASESLPPAFKAWLSVVFRTWGGFMVGFGIVLAASGMSLWRRDARWSRWGLASASVFAFGSFLLSNLQIRSDFGWFIGALFALAAACSVSVLGLRRQGPSGGHPSKEGVQ